MKDIEMESGDVVLRGKSVRSHDSLQRHRLDLLQFNKGDNRFFPTLGVGLINYLNDNATLPGVGGVLRSECNRDGIAPPRKVAVDGQSITIYE